jgi:hypothetical protein
MDDIDIAAWVKASVTRADTHVYWSGISCRRLGSSTRRLPDEPLFADHLCAIEVFVDLIKRRFIGEVERSPKPGKPFFSDSAWEEIRATVEACRREFRVPQSAEELAPERVQYLLPAWHLEYHLDVEKVAADSILFDFSLGGYKYKADNLTVNKQAFYVYADKLRARIRFKTDWAAVAEAMGPLVGALNSPVLIPIRTDLRQCVDQLQQPQLRTYEGVCAEMLRLMEKLLRNIHEERGWPTRGAKLDKLIQNLVGNLRISEDLEQTLKLISKPYRDYVQHGHPLSPTVSKTLLATAMEAIAGIAALIEEHPVRKKPITVTS